MLAIQDHFENKGQADECLWPYLKSRDQASTQASLDQLLVDIAKPLVERIVQRALRDRSKPPISGEDAHDITGEVLLKLLQRLIALKSDPAANSISSFRGMVAITTYRTLTDQIREVDRQRANQERKLRRLFAANPKLSLWRDRLGKLVCGYQAWRVVEPCSTSPKHVYPNLLSLVKALNGAQSDFNTAERVMFLIDQTQSPIRFADLVSALFVNAVEPDFGDCVPSSNADSTPTLAGHPSVYEQQLLLGELFDEIGKLNIVQRQALLLNMTDSYGFSIEWFVFTGIATQSQLASILGVSTDEFAELLDRLPMTDKEIAALLNLDAAKLGNIRKAVRDRLKRRRQAFLRGDR